MTDPADLLLGLLEEERGLLVAGDLSRLPDVRSRTQEALAALRGRSVAPAVLDDLQKRAARNEKLIVSAQLGLRAAIRRLDDCRRAASGLTTYGPDGQVTTAKESQGRLERRA